MKFSCIMLATGKVPQACEAVAAFLAQTEEDSELLIVNILQRQTLVFAHERVKIYNIKTQPMPLVAQAKNYAMQCAKGDVLLAWDECAAPLPDFLASVHRAIEGREWVLFSKEFAVSQNTLVIEPGSEFSFAFTRKAFNKCGPYPPGLNGASDRSLLTKITTAFPGKPTDVQPNEINLIRLHTSAERERIGPVINCGQIKLAPKLSRDYMAMAEFARTGKRENRLCVVELGRYGDIINLLPVLKHMHDNYETPHMMVSKEFADLLDGVSYVKPYVTNLYYGKVIAAMAIARQDYQIVIHAQCWAEDWGATQRPKIKTRHYNLESWSNCGYLQKFDDENMRPVFDRRDEKRESDLLAGIRGYDGRPMILVAVTGGISSPCPQCADLLAEIKSLWGTEYHVINLAEHRSHRLYDFLGVMEAAAVLCSIDTAWLHLAVATNIPVVAITSPKGEGWGATKVRCGNAVRHIPYDKVMLNNRQELHESIAAALQRPNPKLLALKTISVPPKRRVFHLVDRFEETDKRTLERKMRAWETWDSLYETGQLIPLHCWLYPRNAKTALDNPKPLPFFRDLLEWGMKQIGDDDILCWGNDDNFLHSDLPVMLQYHVSVHGPCSIFRTEFRGTPPSFKLSPENIARHSKERHVGRDGFAFSKRWLAERWNEIPDWVLGCRVWDIHAACWIRLHYGIKTTNQNIFEQILPAEIPNGYSGHQAHTSSWLANVNSPGGVHNGSLFQIMGSETPARTQGHSGRECRVIPLCIFTLALDAMRFLPRQLEVFEKLQRPWHWYIVSGVADNVLDTQWCAKIEPRLSLDGTDEWLTAHISHPNLTILRRQLWPGKNAMVNAALSLIKGPCAVQQIDSDEFWTPDQLEKICQLYETGYYDRMRFLCRYYVGENIVVTTENQFANRPGEWSRSWLWRPGMASERHEPPVMRGVGPRELARHETRKMGLIFEHEAYKYIETVQFKERYYKYAGAVEGWKRLQAHTQFPTKLRPFMNWVEEGVVVDKI